MSGVFKSLQPKDVRVTPFKVGKTMTATFDANESSSLEGIKVFNAEHTLTSSYDFYQQAVYNLDDGNDYYSTAFAQTTDGYYKTVMLTQLDHLFYKYYLDNNNAAIDVGDVNYQYRDLGYKAKIISLASLVIGEGIEPGSLRISGSAYRLRDDSYGNIILDVDSGITQAQYKLYDNALCSYTFNNYYEYIGEGLVSSSENTTYGNLRLRPAYHNVTFNKVGTGGSVAVGFRPADESMVKLQAVENSLVKDIYNFQNKDYAIAFGVKLDSVSLAVDMDYAGVVLSKEEPVLDWYTDPAGNVVMNTAAPSQYPYKILIEDTTGKIVFNKTDSAQSYTLKSSTGMSSVYKNVIVQRTGSAIEIYVNGALDATGTDPFYNSSNCSSRERDCANNSDLTLGNTYTGLDAISGSISYFHIFDRALSSAEASDLHLMSGSFNRFCGNVFYNSGIIALTHPRLTGNNVTSISYKSTKTIYETEVYCTVGPGEYTVTYNKSLQSWNPATNQYEIACKYTGSEFRPYVTTIGLYDNSNNLVAVGKLSTPIQTSRTTDTTFVVKYDR